MLLGGVTYILHRPDSLLMFRWFEAIGLDPTIEALRDAPIAKWAPPGWWTASAPAALWLASGLLALFAIWGPHAMRRGWPWFAIVLAAGFGGELGQLVDLVPGTFDPNDLVGTAVAALAAFAFAVAIAIALPSTRPRSIAS